MIRRAIATSVAAALLALAIPQTTQAQSIYLLAGLSVPSSDYGDFADTGWLGAGGVTFPIGEAGLWAGAEGMYGQNSFSSDAVDENWKLFSAMGIIGYDIPTESTVSPYLFGGLGLMSLSSSLEGSDSESGFGWQIGGGVGFETGGNVSPFVEGRYQSASLGDEGEDATVAILGIEAGVSIGIGGDN